LKSKYGNKKAIGFDDKNNAIEFHSIAERDRFNHLKLLEKSGRIQDLTLQPKFELMPAFVRNGKKQLPVNYIADFRYFENKRAVIEDVKGLATKDYLIKRKLFLAKFESVIFREVKHIGSRWEILEL
jgi:hypothetical protein